MATEIRSRLKRRRGSFKQARFIRVHGYLFVLGLEWHETREPNKRYLRQLAKNSKGSYGTLLGSSNESSPLFGVVADAKQGRRARSGAAYLANNYDQAVVILPLDNEIYWLCAVINGEVLIGKDIVSSIDTIRVMASELLSLNSGFQCVGDEQCWSEAGIKHPVEALSIDELFIKEECIAVPYLEHYGSRRWLWVAVSVAALCLASIGVHLVYRDWQQQEALRTTEAIEKDPREIAISMHDDTVLSAFMSEGLHHANGRWVRRVLSLLDNTPLASNGWGLKEVACDFNSDQCIQSWESTVGSYADFLSARTTQDDQSNVTFVNPKKIENTIQLVAKQQLLAPLKNKTYISSFLTELPKQRDFQISDVSILQSVGVLDMVNFGVDSLPTTTYSAPPSFQSIHPLGHLAIGDWQLDGRDLIILLGAVQLLNPSVFHIQSLTMTLNASNENDTVIWSIKGRYTTQGNY